MENSPSYYAIVPAVVRYDRNVIPAARLLYGEITALCNQMGYCWAGNSYFEDLYGVSNTTVTSWINSLVKSGHINRTLIYREGTKQIVQRRLYIVDADTKEILLRGQVFLPRLPKKSCLPLPKKSCQIIIQILIIKIILHLIDLSILIVFGMFTQEKQGSHRLWLHGENLP